MPAPAHSATNLRELPRPPQDDAVLVAALARGDQGALAALWRRHASAVRATLYGCLGPDAALDDLLQDIFLVLYRSAASLREPERVRSYLLGAAVRRARFERRTRGRRARWLTSYATETSDAHASPEVEGRDALRTLFRVLEQLPERARAAFVLRYVQALEPSEVAAALGVSLATAKRDLAYARERVTFHARREPALAEYLSQHAGAES